MNTGGELGQQQDSILTLGVGVRKIPGHKPSSSMIVSDQGIVGDNFSQLNQRLLLVPN